MNWEKARVRVRTRKCIIVSFFLFHFCFDNSLKWASGERDWGIPSLFKLAGRNFYAISRTLWRWPSRDYSNNNRVYIMELQRKAESEAESSLRGRVKRKKKSRHSAIRNETREAWLRAFLEDRETSSRASFFKAANRDNLVSAALSHLRHYHRLRSFAFGVTRDTQSATTVYDYHPAYLGNGFSSRRIAWSRSNRNPGAIYAHASQHWSLLGIIESNRCGGQDVRQLFRDGTLKKL